jgi:hypothetical protein
MGHWPGWGSQRLPGLFISSLSQRDVRCHYQIRAALFDDIHMLSAFGFEAMPLLMPAYDSWHHIQIPALRSTARGLIHLTSS